MKRAKLMALLFVSGIAFGQSRSFHLDNPPAAQGYQELLTILRTVAGIADLTADTQDHAINIHTSAAQLAAGEWLIRRLDHSAGDPQLRSAAIYQYIEPGNGDDVMRIFYLKDTDLPAGVQELLTTLRTIVDLQKIFNYAPLNAIVLRGRVAQVAMAAWLIDQLDLPASARDVVDPGAHEFRSPVNADDVVRVFFLKKAQPGTMADALASVRTRAKIQKACLNTPTRSLVVRGTADQIAVAERIVGALATSSAR